MTPLGQLEAAIAAGTFPEHLPPGVDGATLYSAFSGDLNAALMLHNATLPDHRWELWRVPGFGGPVEYGCNIPGIDTVYFNHSPARAWLLAIVRALIAKEPKP